MSELALQRVLALLVFLVVGSIAWVIIQKAIHLLYARYRAQRRAFIEKPLMQYLCGDSAALEQLRSRRAIDRRLIVNALIESAENFGGEFGPRIRQACEELGYVQEYLQRIHNRRWWVRAEAAYRLGLMGSREAEPLLLEALEDATPDVRLMAIRALAALNGDLALKPILQHFKDMSSWGLLELSDIVLRLGPVCVPILMEALDGHWSKEDVVAIDLLGQLKDPRAIPHLIIYLSAPHKETRIRVVKALSLMADAETIPYIRRRATDLAWEVRLMVCTFLSRAGGVRDIPVLLGLLQDSEKRVRVAAAEALMELGNAGKEALYKAGQNGDPFLRYIADQFLGPATDIIQMHVAS